MSGDTALLPGGRRFFDFAQNDMGVRSELVILLRNLRFSVSI